MSSRDWAITATLALLFVLLWMQRRGLIAFGGGATGGGGMVGAGGSSSSGGGCCGGCAYAGSSGNPVPLAGAGDYAQAGLAASDPVGTWYSLQTPHFGTTQPIIGPTGNYTQNTGGDSYSEWP